MEHEAAPPPSPELQQRLQEASELTDEGRWAEAFQILAGEEPSHPRDPTLLCMLGVVATEVDASGLAYDYFRRCLAEDPTDPYLLVALGTGLARYDDPDAERVLRLAALTAPNLTLARLHYGSFLAREGLFELAAAELEAARALDEENPQVAREQAVAYLLSGNGERGADELERAVALDPTDPELRLLFGLGLLLARRSQEAAEELHRAAAELVHDGDAQLLAALSCATQEWWDEAWEALARAEAAASAPDPDLIREAEEAMEEGPEASESLLREEVVPPVLRVRLLERP